MQINQLQDSSFDSGGTEVTCAVTATETALKTMYNHADLFNSAKHFQHNFCACNTNLYQLELCLFGSTVRPPVATQLCFGLHAL